MIIEQSMFLFLQILASCRNGLLKLNAVSVKSVSSMLVFFRVFFRQNVSISILYPPTHPTPRPADTPPTRPTPPLPPRPAFITATHD